MYDNYQQQRGVSTLQELEAENSKKENHDTMKSEVKKFVVYVLGLDPDTLERSEELKRGMFKLSDAIEKKSVDITDEDVESFFGAISFVEDILSSYDKKEEAVQCCQELSTESELELDFDTTIDSFLKFYRDEETNELRTVCCQNYARKVVDSALKNDDKINDEEKQIESPNNNIDVIKTNKDEEYENKEDKDRAWRDMCKKLLAFEKKHETTGLCKYKKLNLLNLNVLLSKMEKCITDAVELKVYSGTDSDDFQNLGKMVEFYREVTLFFLEIAKSDVDKLLTNDNESCKLLDDNIKFANEKISRFDDDSQNNKNKYQTKIKFIKQQINVNVRSSSLSSAKIRELPFVIGEDMKNKLIYVHDHFANTNYNSLVTAVSSTNRYRNFYINEMSKIRNARQKMSLTIIDELKEINKDLDQMFEKQELEKLKQLPKTVNVEHSIKTGFWWWLYKFLNWFINNKQITPQNSLNDQIGAVVRQRFSQFKQADFIIPLNSLIIRSLGIEPDGEQYEIESLFNNTFTTILLPMLNNDLDGQIGSLADALYNVIPQNQDDAQNNSFNGVKYAISQYISDAMVKCWVETIFDFIRMDSANNLGHLSWYNHTFDADKYFDNLKDDENRKNRFEEILHDRFSESLPKIVADIEGAIKDRNNDHEICECLLKRNIELLDFCNKLHDRNFDQLGKYLQDSITRMTPAAKDVLSNLQLNLKFSIFNCRSENEDKAPEKSNKDFLNDLLLSPNKTEYKDAVASKEAFLSNLSPSSKKAYEQSEVLAKESVNDSKLQGEEKQAAANIDLPNAYYDEPEIENPAQVNNKITIINK